MFDALKHRGEGIQYWASNHMVRAGGFIASTVAMIALVAAGATIASGFGLLLIVVGMLAFIPAIAFGHNALKESNYEKSQDTYVKKPEKESNQIDNQLSEQFIPDPTPRHRGGILGMLNKKLAPKDYKKSGGGGGGGWGRGGPAKTQTQPKLFDRADDWDERNIGPDADVE